jgi:hypothetical protein
MSNTQTYPTPLTPSQLNRAESAQWKQIVTQALADTRVATPAFLVEDMDQATQTVTVQIAIQERVRPPQGAAQWWDLPPIGRVPVVMPGGGGASLTFPLKKGDEGLLIFCDTCFDNWWLNGQNSAPIAYNQTTAAGGPGTASGSQQQLAVRRHDFWDCGFLPKMRSQPNLLSNYSASSAQLRMDDGSAIVDIAENLVSVFKHGGTPQLLATNDLYLWIMNELIPFIQGLGYAGSVPPGTSVTSVFKAQ